MAGTRRIFRVSWSVQDTFEEREFDRKGDAVKFGDQKVSEDITYLDIEEVEIEFDEDGDFGESAICLYTYQPK